MIKQKGNENRAEYMLRVAAAYIRNNCPDGKIYYDEAECDGFCVSNDCEIAAEERLKLEKRRADDLESMKNEITAKINAMTDAEIEALFGEQSRCGEVSFEQRVTPITDDSQKYCGENLGDDYLAWYGFISDTCRDLEEKLNRIKAIKFPVMLRKMWSGTEVQKWIEENIK